MKSKVVIGKAGRARILLAIGGVVVFIGIGLFYLVEYSWYHSATVLLGGSLFCIGMLLQ